MAVSSSSLAILIMKVKEFKEELLSFTLIFVFDANEVSAKEYFKKKYHFDGDFSDCWGQVGDIPHKSEKHFYIYLEKGVDISILVHEISHLVFRSLNNRRVDLHTEIVAFYNEYWFKKLFKFLKPKNMKVPQKNKKKNESNQNI